MPKACNNGISLWSKVVLLDKPINKKKESKIEKYVNYDDIIQEDMWKNETCTMLFIFNFYRLLNAGSNQLHIAIHSNIFFLILSIIAEWIMDKNPRGNNSLCKNRC